MLVAPTKKIVLILNLTFSDTFDAFSVRFDEDVNSELQFHSWEHLKFDKVDVNVQNNYDAQSGSRAKHKPTPTFLPTHT